VKKDMHMSIPNMISNKLKAISTSGSSSATKVIR
jgi:hypothetical protein